MPEAEDVFLLVLSVSLLPVVATTVGRMRPKLYDSYFFLAYCFLLASFLFRLLEDFALPGVFNLLQHAAVVGSGCAFLALGLRMRGSSVEEGGE